MKLELIFEPCDLWVGFFWDREKLRLYFLPLPTVGLMLEFGEFELDFYLDVSKALVAWTVCLATFLCSAAVFWDVFRSVGVFASTAQALVFVVCLQALTLFLYLREFGM